MDDGAIQTTLGPAFLDLGTWLHWPIGLWFAWVLGAIAAEAYAGVVCLPGWCTWRSSFLVVAGFSLATSPAALEILVPAGSSLRPALEPTLRILAGCSEPACAVAAFVALNRWINLERVGAFQGPLARSLAKLGVASYSLYLVHMPLTRLLMSLLPEGTTTAFWLLRLAVIVPTCLAFSALFFLCVERHFLVPRRQGSFLPRLPLFRRSYRVAPATPAPAPVPVKQTSSQGGVGAQQGQAGPGAASAA
jgi:peptidoglycan/LPS O-acetylase OafA/YrhL